MSNSRIYRTEIPNIVDDSDLSPHAFRLYAHIKRVAGDNGECYKGTKTLAEACRMSTGMVSKARKELLNSGLVEHLGSGPNGAWRLKPVNIWQRNADAYAQIVHNMNDTEDKAPETQANEPAERSHNEQPEPPQTPNHSDSEQLPQDRSHCEPNRSQCETKKEPLRKNINNDDDPPAPAEDERFAEIIKLYGKINPLPGAYERQVLGDAYDELGAEELEDIVRVSIRAKARSIRYLERVIGSRIADKVDREKAQSLVERSCPAVQFLLEKQEAEGVPKSKRLNITQREKIEQLVTNVELWKSIITAGRLRGYSITNTEWMTDRYQDPSGLLQEENDHGTNGSQPRNPQRRSGTIPLETVERHYGDAPEFEFDIPPDYDAAKLPQVHAGHRG